MTNNNLESDNFQKLKTKGVMKNLLTTIALMIMIFSSSNALMANTIPVTGEEELVLVNSNNVVFTLDNTSDAKAFESVTYNNITKMMKVDVKGKIAFVEILNEKGQLEFLMPVGAKVLNIDLLDFAKGNYTVNLKMQESSKKIISSSLVKAF